VLFLRTNRQTVQINPDATYFADVQAFTDLLDSDPTQAVELYRGDFLADFYLPDSETFETWAAARWAVIRLGYVYLRLDEDAQAYEVLAKSLHLFNDIGSIDGVIFVIERFASIAVSYQQPVRAARLFAWSDTTRAANQDPRPFIEQVDVDRDTAVIIDMIGHDAYCAAYDEGKKLTAEEVVAIVDYLETL